MQCQWVATNFNKDKEADSTANITRAEWLAKDQKQAICHDSIYSKTDDRSSKAEGLVCQTTKIRLVQHNVFTILLKNISTKDSIHSHVPIPRVGFRVQTRILCTLNDIIRTSISQKKKKKKKKKS